MNAFNRFKGLGVQLRGLQYLLQLSSVVCPNPLHWMTNYVKHYIKDNTYNWESKLPK